jgi:hypothetical protein
MERALGCMGATNTLFFLASHDKSARRKSARGAVTTLVAIVRRSFSEYREGAAHGDVRETGDQGYRGGYLALK